MSPLAAAKSAFRNYFNVRGRATRSEFWWFQLFVVVVPIALLSIPTALGTGLGGYFGLAGSVLLVGTFIPRITVAVRRLHDTGRSGWWLLIALIPCLGALVLLVFFLLGSKTDVNEQGGSSASPPGAPGNVLPPALALVGPAGPAEGSR